MESGSSLSLPSQSESVQPSPNESETIEESSRPSKRSKTSSKRPPVPKSQRSKYWAHCVKGTRTLSDGRLQDIAICNYCKIEIPVNYGSTSGLINHLVKRCKSSPLYKPIENEKGQPTLTNESMGQESALVPHTFNQKMSELKLTEYVIIDVTSFRSVEGKGFIALLNELQPRFRIPGRKKIAGMVYDLFLVEKAKIKSAFDGQRVSITTDTWTSIQNINYMVITAHFLDSDWNLHKRIINFTKITSHAGEEIGKLVEICLKALVCTNDWLRAEEISLFRDPTDDELDFYKEIEEVERGVYANHDISSTPTTTSTWSKHLGNNSEGYGRSNV